MNCAFRHVQIDGITAVVPQKSVCIDDEIVYFQNSPQKLARAKKIIGYGTRHVVDEGVTATDLCEAAARRLLEKLDAKPNEFDTLLFVNQSPDHILPTSACILHGRLGLSKHCATVDVPLGCSGAVYGLWLAHSLIASGACQKILLLAGDTPSLHSRRQNRLTNPLFGDAGTAIILSRSSEERTAWFSLGSDGTGYADIIIPAGGFRLPVDVQLADLEVFDESGNCWKLTDTLLNGMNVFNFTLREVPCNVINCLAFAGKTIADIDFFAFHQANRQIITAIGQRIGLEEDRIHSATFSKYGNQSTASVPCVVCDALHSQTRLVNKTLLLCGYGVGLSWGSAVINFDGAFVDTIQLCAPDVTTSREERIAGWIAAFQGK